MTELGPRARALFDAARGSLQPNLADRERIRSALSARIAGLGPEHGETTGASAGTSGLGWPGIAAIAFGLALAGAGVFALLRPAAPASVAPAPSNVVVVVSPQPDPAPTPTIEQGLTPAPSSESAASTVLEAPHAGARPTATAPASDRLAEEVAILSQAERDLHAGQYQSALGLLDEHRRKFPRGTLAEERMEARVQALCGLGRVSEAQTEMARLTRLTPNSAHEARPLDACATKH